jgi:hypothetical protein
MNSVQSTMDPPQVRPSDFANSAAVLLEVCRQQGSLSQCIGELAAQNCWSPEYSRAICLRHVALGRYLSAPATRAGIPEPLLLLAASVAPLTTLGEFDPGLLESVARACAEQLPSANAAAA